MSHEIPKVPPDVPWRRAENWSDSFPDDLVDLTGGVRIYHNERTGYGGFARVWKGTWVVTVKDHNSSRDHDEAESWPSHAHLNPEPKVEHLREGVELNEYNGLIDGVPSLQWAQLEEKLPGACTRCKNLKVKCDFATGKDPCKRCLRGGHECVIPGRKKRRTPPMREHLLAQIRDQAALIQKLMAQLEGRPYPSTEEDNCAGDGDGGARELLAIKVLTLHLPEHEEQLKLHSKRLMRELKVWEPLRHENIVPLYGIAYNVHTNDPRSDSSRFPAMVSPWYENGNLNEFLSTRGTSLDRMDRIDMIQDVLNGLTYLHDKSIVHGDLSGGNVLVHANGVCSVTDFGLSAVINELGESSHITSSQNGTARWASPELFRPGEFAPSQRRSMPGDIYSFGNIALQILSGALPWSHLSADYAVIIALSQGQTQRRPASPGVTDEDWQLLLRCWKVDPSERPTARETLEFAWFDVDSSSSTTDEGTQADMAEPGLATPLPWLAPSDRNHKISRGVIIAAV